MKKKKSDGNDDDAPSTQQSLESWLQSHLPEDYNIRRETTPGKKRVSHAFKTFVFGIPKEILYNSIYLGSVGGY